MKKYTLLLVLTCFITGLFAQNKSNKGKEFWVGYGHNQISTTTNPETLVLYLSAEQAANVIVSIPSIGWSQNYSIAANSAISTTQIPYSARITAEGISNNGIHIESDVPIVAYAHQYGGSSSGATMLMPVETYGYNYYSLNYTQQTNSTPAYSWFFVVASEDNTKLQITPSVTTQGGKPANTTFTVTLNKGQIYNVFGQSSGTTGQDVSGSKISSVADINGICHPIGVFSGASRMTICNTSSGEFMWQQIFPASAWGTKYLLYPTVSTNNVATANINFYRIAVRDPATVVKRNGVILTGLQNNFYYDIYSNTGEFIESDKPILVEQLTPSTNTPCSISGYPSYNGLGDPEMFYISPVEQAVKKAVFYTTPNQAISLSYVCAIIPLAGINSLKIDGSTSFDRVLLHPQNSNYRVVIKRWTESSSVGGQQHIIESDSAFTAIVYGLGSVESYGYNAGTMINNLNALGAVQNTFSSIGATTNTCPGSPFKFSIQVAYKPTEMIWKLSQVGNKLLPASVDTTLTNPIPKDSSTINGRKYYTYSLPREYTFSDTGTYTIPITCTAPEIDNCNNTEDVTYTIKVNRGPIPDFTWTYSGCVSDTAYFTGTPNANGYTLSKYRWFYDDNTQDSVLNPKKKFNTQGPHAVKFRAIATNGCVGDSTKIVTTAPSPVATFGMNPTQACGSATVTFSDTSSFAGSTLNEYYWDFGNGNTLITTSNANQTQNYPSWGTYTIKHYAGVSGGCKSDTAKKILNIYAKPNVNFGYTIGCLQDSTVQFSDSTTIPDAQTLSWSWDFGDASSGVNNTSTLQHPTHKYTAYGTYLVTLTVTTNNGCSNSFARYYTVTGFASSIQYSISKEDSLCSQSLVKLTNNAIITQDSIYKIDIYWDFANNPTVFETDNTPTQNEQYTHQYNVFTTPQSKTYTIKWIVYSKGGCVSEKTRTITLYAKPTTTFAVLASKCVNAGLISVANGSVTNGLSGTSYYYGTGTDALGNFNPANGVLGLNTVYYVFESNKGCRDTVSQTIKIWPKPTAKFGYERNVCLGDSIKLSDSSSVVSGNISQWNWDFGDATNAIKTNNTPFFKNYGNANSYTVKLVAISDSSCISDTFSLPVTVYPKPVSTFSISSLRCADSLITITPTSSFANGTIQSWYYNFGNSQSTAVNNNNPVTTNYTSANSYTIKHVVNAGLGCISDTSFQTFTIFANPVADFTMSSGCLPDSTASFFDATSVLDGQSFSWKWNFGDPSTGANNTSILQNPTHKYTLYNSYTVKLISTTVNGCSSSKDKTFSVFGFVPTISYSIANENSLCCNKIVSLTHKTPIAIDSIYKVEIYWDFANNPTIVDSDNTPTLNEVYTHSYAVFTNVSSKDYTIKIKTYSKGGCTSETTKVVTVYAMPVITYNNMTGVCINNGNISVANATIANGIAGSGKYYGNGTDTLGNFNPVLAGVGLHNIKYIFATTGGCIDSATAQIRVFPKPDAGFKISNNICLSDSLLLTDTSKIATGSIKERHWDFGDNTSAIKTDALPFYKKYTNFNSYTIKLNVISDSLCLSDTITKTVEVYPLPQIAFTLPSGVCMPLGEAKFTNNSTISGGSVTTLSYVWNFGDNTTSPVINPTHYYTAFGPFDIKLKATSLKGCSDSLTQTLSAFYNQPIADFAIIGDTLCPNKMLLFSDSSIATNTTINQWNWDFGNGDTSHTSSPVYAYKNPGKYYVSLIVSTPDGCTSNQHLDSITIYKQPIVDAGNIIYTPEGVSVPILATINDTTAGFWYKWTPAIYLNSDTALKPICTPIFSTNYRITAYGLGNCISTDTVRVVAFKQLNIPNAFSPNGDGKNDKWEVAYLNDYPKCKIEVFDRNGQPVFTSVGYNKPWDGTLNGKALPVGTYYYIIELNNNGYSKLSGSVTILR